MSQTKKIPAFKAFAFSLGLIMIGTFCFPYIHYNGSTGGYDQDPPPPGIQGNISMEILVTQGASYYFKAQINIQTLLNHLELRDLKWIDFETLKRLIIQAFYNITYARLTFTALIEKAETTPYNLDVIERLNTFDYDTFMKEKGLNPFIFGIVRDYLSAGDITGTYKRACGNFKEIEQLLLHIQSSTLENRLP